MARFILLYGLLLCLTVNSDQSFEDAEKDGEIYTNYWAVQLDTHDETQADEVASSLGFKNHGKIANLPGYFKFVHEQTESRQKRSAEHHTQPLLAHPRVQWAQQQTLLFRHKRGSEAMRYARAERNRRLFNDPKWGDEWYFGKLDADDTRGNLGILEALERGYTGKGVVVTIVDDGLDHTHPDLKRNYDPLASYDVNDNDPDPMPDVSKLDNAHGTKCAGEVAAEANNEVCGVGVAQNAKIGGVRMLDGPVTDVVEANALGHRCNDHVDIISASWGPKDDGKTFGKPETLASEKMKRCALEGRQGKGTLYVWATGNGGISYDDCNCDGYTSSIYTLSVGSISPSGFRTAYDEKCPSTMAVVYTGDVGVGKRETYSTLVTTSLHHDCVTSFSGTSCAAPLAAGIFALVLEANPDLTWRDMQHLVVETAQKNDPEGASWSKNAAGHFYSRSYGFGVLNAAALIDKAKGWNHVPEQRSYNVAGTLTRDSATIPSKGARVLKVPNDKEDISKLEHAQLVLSVKHRRRGDMIIELVSPQGTTSRLLDKRSLDDSEDGLEKWHFTTVELWNEDPRGEWTVKIRDEKSENEYSPRWNSRLSDEGESPQRDEPANLANDLSHGRFKDDYMRDAPEQPSSNDMKLAKRSLEKFLQREDEPSYQRELSHGRFKEDYMKDAPQLPNNMASDESDWCSPSDSLQGPVAGCVTEWSLILYGTA